jgi:hypothetical protein
VVTGYFGVRVSFEFQTGVPKKTETALVEVHVPESALVAEHVVVPLLREKFGNVEYALVASA